MDTADVVDKAALLARLQGDTAALRTFCRLFIEDCPRRLAAIRDALDRADAASVAGAAHSMKGAVAIFTSGAAHHAAATLEQLGRQNDLEAACAAFGALDRELASLTQALELLIAAP